MQTTNVDVVAKNTSALEINEKVTCASLINLLLLEHKEILTFYLSKENSFTIFQ